MIKIPVLKKYNIISTYTSLQKSLDVTVFCPRKKSLHGWFFLTLSLKHSIVPNNIMTIEHNNIVLWYYNIHKKRNMVRLYIYIYIYFG